MSHGILVRMVERFGEDLSAVCEEGGEARATVHLRRLAECLEFCRSDPRLDLRYPAALTAYDTGDDFVLIYRLVSIERAHTLLLQARIPRSDPVAPSAAQLWKGVDWHEREVFDMFGIRFEGHPDLRRILLPDDWPGYPFRKDYASEPSGSALEGPQPMDSVGGRH